MKILQLMRPSHWVKNIFVFAALVFGRKLFGPLDEVLLSIGSAVGGFLCFCMAASATYIFNDIIDRQNDKSHPEKCKRPIAAGDISVAQGVFWVFLFVAAALFCSYLLTMSLTVVILIYLVISTIYTLLLKDVMILDCIIISVGFCMRAVAGAIVVGVYISPWLIICSFTLCLFLAFGKRRSEMVMLGDNGHEYRKTLAGYSIELLDHMLDVTGGLAIMCFLLYSMDSRTEKLFGTTNLVYTSPIVMYCVFRFSALIQRGQYSGPVKIIVSDRPFQMGFFLWVAACIAIIYADKLGVSLSGVWMY
ncbi:MAG TPA: decaprenyl-phosphate phosphoribosyltransferase [Sedimentisphaerales bacterium]|nr:decaprenyl-phosphate phosphoribosyltransferase [Sedimentisphaerales bacterium]